MGITRKPKEVGPTIIMGLEIRIPTSTTTTPTMVTITRREGNLMGTSPTRTEMYNRGQIITLPIRHARLVARTTPENVVGEP